MCKIVRVPVSLSVSFSFFVVVVVESFFLQVLMGALYKEHTKKGDDCGEVDC